jgi:hypothetical protein
MRVVGGCKGLLQLLEQCSNSKQASSSGSSAGALTIKACPPTGEYYLGCCSWMLLNVCRLNNAAVVQALAPGSSAVSRNAQTCEQAPQLTHFATAFVSFCAGGRALPKSPPLTAALFLSLQGRSWQLCPACQQLLLCCVMCLRHHSTARAVAAWAEAI